MFEPFAIVVIAGTFFLAGTVKGVIGLGLPTVSLGMLAAALDLTTAMALLIVPSFVTNVWQAAVGGNGWVILRRLWPFLFTATVCVWLGAVALTRLDLNVLTGLLGGLLAAYAAFSLTGVHLTIATEREAWVGPLLGAVNGILTGMTGSFVVPGVMFLQAIGLSRDMLVQAMGVLFTVSTVALAVALQGNSLLTSQLSLTSAAAVVPAVIGMVAGQRIRRNLSEGSFRKTFFIAILLLGIYLIVSVMPGGW